MACASAWLGAKNMLDSLIQELNVPNTRIVPREGWKLLSPECNDDQSWLNYKFASAMRRKYKSLKRSQIQSPHAGGMTPILGVGHRDVVAPKAATRYQSPGIEGAVRKAALRKSLCEDQTQTHPQTNQKVPKITRTTAIYTTAPMPVEACY